MASQEPLSVDIGRASPLVFKNAEEAGKWVATLRDSWAWLSDEKIRPVRTMVNNINQLVPSGLDQIAAGATDWSVSSTADPSNFVAAVRAFFADRKIPLTSDPAFQTARLLVERGDPVAAAAAIASAAGIIRLTDNASLNRSLIKGVVALELAEAELLDANTTPIANSLKTLSDEFSTLKSNTEIHLAHSEAAFENLLISANSKLDEQETTVRTEWTEKIEESIKSIKATEAAFREQMKLKASVDYWKDRAIHHQARANSMRNYLIWYCILGGIALIIALVGLSLAAIHYSTSGNELSIFVKFAAVSAVITTIALWIGRTLLRIFLSERHLATDAEERRTMVMTYLALTDEGKLEPSDRALVLAPIFRTAADGIVKDDGPDATLAGIIAKTLEPRK